MATRREEIEAAWKAQEEAEKLAAEKRAAVKRRNQLPLGGKSTVIAPDKSYPLNLDPALDKAYDAVQNMDESMAEDAEENARRAKARLSAARSKK